jgi:hypothetical protein
VGRGFCYADAVKLLGGQESRTVAALDRLAGGALLATSATGAGAALSLLGARSELARLGHELVGNLGERLRGLRRFDRSERLAAAHAVIVVTAYFEALDEVDLPFDAGELALTAADQAGLAGSTETGTAGSPEWRLLRAEVPMPTPQSPYEVTLKTLARFYSRMSDEVCEFAAGLAGWDRLDERARRRWRDTVTGELPGLATERYEEQFRRLAIQCPELAFWANLVDHQATRAEIRKLEFGLAGLQQALTGLGEGGPPDQRRHSLARRYSAELSRPILPVTDDQDGPRIPQLGQAYVNPDFRVGEVVAAERIAEEDWWAGQPVREDLQEFLLGHLTAPQATEAPLLVLGQPGSGKSVLTKVLAARLPPSEFLVVRVVLREVPADADLQAQIEYAVRSATGEILTWPQLVRSAGDALPVVLLDGFDELLQATGVSQSDYLERVEAFQRREADLGHPVAVLVTSRTAVADRVRAARNMVTVRLEPFGTTQITRWCTVWNAANADWLRSRSLLPLSTATLQTHRELACQPLLLLMLALYDANGNALQGDEGQLETADLYERLLGQFAEREVDKTGAALPQQQRAQAVDRELLRLSVVALAMFNRHRQWVTEAELDADLTALLGEPGAPRTTPRLRAELTAAQVVIGRFFFVHQTQAIRDDTKLRTYEFLHATFGEYLIARLVVRELVELAAVAELNATRSRPAPTDDAFLHALLSFAPLTTRGTVASFVAERLRKLPETRRKLITDLVLPLFRNSLQPRHASPYDGYRPGSTSVPARHAAYSMNLVLLAVLSAGEMTTDDLFPESPDPIAQWRDLAMLWRSQLRARGWSGLVDSLQVRREWQGDRRQVRLRWESPPDEPVFVKRYDPYWTHGHGPNSEWRPPQSGSWFNFTRRDFSAIEPQYYFQCDADDDALLHAFEPLLAELASAVNAFLEVHGWPADGAVSPAQALLRLWLALSKHTDPDQLAAAHDTCLKIAIYGFSPGGTGVEPRRRYRRLVLRLLAMNRARLPEAFLRDAADQLKSCDKETDKEPAELLALARKELPWLLPEDPAPPATTDG